MIKTRYCRSCGRMYPDQCFPIWSRGVRYTRCGACVLERRAKSRHAAGERLEQRAIRERDRIEVAAGRGLQEGRNE